MSFRAVFVALLTAATFSENAETARNELSVVFHLSSPVIQTLNGAVRGRTIRAGNGRFAQELLNIPYAQPPVGSLRFRPPQPVKNWLGERDGSKLGNACLQNAGKLAKIFPDSKFEVDVDPSTINEDCLSINVYIPYPISNAKNNDQTTTHKEDGLPVLVWFHGGGFQWGSNNLNLYNASTLASEINVVVVIVNYRLNIFGFLTLPGIGINGNQGLLDQTLAIKWIRENSRSFGGNPEQITLFGESAGSASVQYHLLSPMSRGLFARGIMQSGSAAATFWSYHTPHQAHQTSREFATAASCDSFDDASDEFSDQKAFVCLQSKSVEELLAADAKMKETNKFTLLPTIDGSFLPRSPSDMLQAGDFKRAPIMIGSTANESIWLLAMYFPELISRMPDVHLSEEEFDRMLFELTPTLSNTTRDAIKFVYRNWTVSTNNEHQMRLLHVRRSQFRPSSNCSQTMAHRILASCCTFFGNVAKARRSLD